MTQDYATRTVNEAEQLIATGDLPNALDKLRTAVAYVPSRDEADAKALAARIGDLADAIAARDPSYAAPVQALKEGLAHPPQRARAAVARTREPWFYLVATVVSILARVLSVLSFIGGIVVGVQASRYHRLFDGLVTHYRARVIVEGILSGIVSALIFLAVAAALSLLVDNGRMLRATRG